MNDEDQDYFVLVIGALAAVLAVLAIVILLGTRLGIGVAANNGETVFSGGDAEEVVEDEGAERTTAIVELDGDSITLTGVVSDESIREDLVGRAEASVGAANVDDQLEVDAGADPTTGVVTLIGSGAAGSVESVRTEFLPVDTDLGLNVNDQLAASAAANPAAAVVDASGDGIVLTGTVPDEATRSLLAERAADQVGAALVTDELVVDDSTTAEGASITLIGGVAADEADALNGAFSGLDPWSVSDQLVVEAEAPTTTTPAVAEGLELEGELEELFALNPIQFDLGSANIRAESQPTLDEAVTLIQADTTSNVSIEGHTDSQGDDAANQALSQSRSDSVLGYLVGAGVEGTRLTATGFGEGQLKVDPEVTDADFETNRRIEWKVSPAG